MRRKFVPGCLLSPPDRRDYRLTLCHAAATIPCEYTVPLIESIPVFSQGNRGVCVAAASSAIKEWQELYERGSYEDLSPEYVYDWCKALDGHHGEGTYPRIAMAVLRDKGICTERLCPYRAVNYTPQPTPEMDNDARRNRIERYARADSTDVLKRALMDHGPVLIGVPVYANWMHARAGIIPLPKGDLEGGHALVIYGWTESHWRIRNSWGHDWGQNGNGLLPLDYPGVLDDAWLSVDVSPALRLRRGEVDG